MPTSRDAKLRDVQALLNTILEEAPDGGNEAPSHWELPILPPPDAEGQLSSTDLLNWWFRAPHNRARGRDDSLEPPGGSATPVADRQDALRGRATEPAGHDRWSEISVLLPEPEEHLAEEHAQAAVDCLYDFLHAVGQRDIDGAAALIHDFYHTIEEGEEIDKQKFVNFLASQLDALRDWDFDVSLAVAPEPVNHPYGVLIHAIVQFDAVHLRDGSKDGHVEERVAILREDESGAWKIAALPRVGR